MSPDDGEFAPLRGLRVLEIGDGVAGAAAGSLLASYGAEVTTVVDRSSLRRRRPPLALDDGEPRSLACVIFDVGKTVIDNEVVMFRTKDPSETSQLAGQAAFESADVVICDRVGGPAPPAPADADSFVSMVERVNPGVWVTISAFGLVGPRRDESASELVVAAAGGLLSVVSDADTGRAVPLPGSQALLSTGQAAALAACHGLDQRRRRGETVHVDVSAQAATVATGPVMKVVGRLLASSPVGGAARYAAPAGFYRCRDGLLRVSALEEHQWRGLTEAFDRLEWRERFPSPAARVEHADEIDALITELTRTRAKAECEATLQAAGVPTAAVYSPREILASAQLAARRALASHAIGGREARYVARPFRIRTDGTTDAPGPPAGLRAGLGGLRVAEAGHVLAVPLAGALLGAMGADVVKLEDPDRVDMFRRNRPFVDDQPGQERAVYFSMVNHSKRSVVLSFERCPDALHGIVDRSDVLLENLGPSRAAKVGLDADGARATHPGLLAVSSSAHGSKGPWSHYRAYAYSLHASSGVAHLTRSASGEPASLEMAWADVITGYAIATVVAAWAVGGRQAASVDFSMGELVASRFNEFLAAESLGATDAGIGADDANLIDPAMVADAEALLADEQLAAFGLFTGVDHPEWGRRLLVGLPWRFVGEPTIALRAPPCFGATARIPDDAAGDVDPWSTDLAGVR